MNIDVVSPNSYRNTWNTKLICWSPVKERDMSKSLMIMIMIWATYSLSLKWSENTLFHSHKNKKRCSSLIWKDKTNSASFLSLYLTELKMIPSMKLFTLLMIFGKSLFSSKIWITHFSKLSNSLKLLSTNICKNWTINWTTLTLSLCSNTPKTIMDQVKTNKDWTFLKNF